MSNLSLSEGRVCIIKVKNLTNTKDGLAEIKNALVDFTTSDRVQESSLDTYIFVDMSPFNIINSSLIGVLGSIIMDQKIQLLALCGLQNSVADILVRFGVIGDRNNPRKFASAEINENLAKVLTFRNVEEGLASLNPR